MNWFEAVQRYIAQAVAIVFGLDPASDEAADFIRFPYKDNSTTMQANNNKNVCYVSLSAAPEMSNRPFAQTAFGSNGKADIQRAIPLSCAVTFYGPMCDINAELLRTGIMFDGGAGTPRFFLREHKIVPVSMPDAPNSMPEVIDGYWRRRADLTIRIMYYMVHQFNFKPITSTDIEIGVHNN